MARGTATRIAQASSCWPIRRLVVVAVVVRGGEEAHRIGTTIERVVDEVAMEVGSFA